MGGGILNNGTLTVSNTTIYRNSASSDGGGIANVFLTATLTVRHCALTYNSAPRGGGISNTKGGTLTVSDSEFKQNKAAFNGGGIFNGFAGTATLRNSTLDYNSASLSGGGIANLWMLTVSNSTLFSNTAGSGGGIANLALLSLGNSTLSGNTAFANGGGISQTGVAPNLGSSIVAGNAASSGPDINGAVNSAGANLIGQADGSNGYIGSDQTGTSASPLDPKLGPLADNGGPRETMALLPGSPAIGKGLCAWPSGAPFPAVTTDQRYAPRKSPCDAGAFESGASPMPPPQTPIPTLSPIQKLQALAKLVVSFNLDAGTANSLTVKLQAAESAVNRGDLNTAVNNLQAFIHEVEAQRGKKLTAAQADALIAQAQALLDLLSGGKSLPSSTATAFTTPTATARPKHTAPAPPPPSLTPTLTLTPTTAAPHGGHKP